MNALTINIAIAFMITLILSLFVEVKAQGRAGNAFIGTAMPPVDYFAPVPNQLEINKWMDFLEAELSLNSGQKVRIKKYL